MPIFLLIAFLALNASAFAAQDIKPAPSPSIVSAPTTQTKEPASPSLLEQSYGQRVVQDLEQYGYEMLQAQSNPISDQGRIPTGAVGDDFILSYGDTLDIHFSGQRNDNGRYAINSQGVLMIDDFPAIPAAGRSMRSVRGAIERAAHSQYNTQAYVALASVRQIDVLVIGHAKQPGRKTLTVFHTLLDALSEAGGIDKSGSLRQIKLVRDGRSHLIDLYGLFMHGNTSIDLSLRDGDRIIVPPIGPTVAIAGDTKRPGIYEILPDLQGMTHTPSQAARPISLNEMLGLGGGLITPGDHRFLRLDIGPDGQEHVTSIEEAFAPLFSDGAILMASKGKAKRAGLVELSGHSRKNGMHALEDARSLSALLSSPDIMGPNIYPLIGVIERWDTDQMTTRWIDFPLRLVLKGDYDQRLQDGDRILLFSKEDIFSLQDADDADDKTELEQGSLPDADETTGIFDDSLRDFLKERGIFIRGAVRNSGLYPVSEGMTLDSALAVAGGLALEANTSNIEITTALGGKGHQARGASGTRRMTVNFTENNPKSISLQAGDSVRVNQKFHKIADNSVLIMGEVSQPGRYDLMPGDKVSDLVIRAGGLTAQAYPEGAIFSRASERKAEETRFKAQARMMRQAVASAIQARQKDDESDINSGQIAEARALAAELDAAQGVGRITAEIDPAVLSSQPALDMLLERGDRIFVPKRSLSVRVSGEVLSPAVLQFKEGKDPLDYIHEAGGFTYHADKDRSFVLYPDGSAQPLQVNAWNYSPLFIPPGATVIVPRDPKPFDFVESFKDVSQILSNLAVTGIFIDDVRDD